MGILCKIYHSTTPIFRWCRKSLSKDIANKRRCGKHLHRALAIMNYKNKIKSGRGSAKKKEPRLIGSIIAEMLQSNSPLARGYRSQQVSQKGNVAEKGGIA